MSSDNYKDIKIGKNRTKRVFEDGRFYDIFRHPEGLCVFSIRWFKDSVTGPYWDAMINVYPEPQNVGSYLRCWSSGDTRKEAVQNLRQQLKGVRLMNELTKNWKTD